MVPGHVFNTMPRVVVVLPSTTYRAGDFVTAADSLGVDLVVASEQPPPFNMGDRYLQIDCSDTENAAEAVAALGDHVPIDAVVAADDGGVMVAALAGSTLGLASNSPEAAATTRDKINMRRRLAATEVPQPDFRVRGPDDDPLALAEELGYPLVVKPPDRSASQGVIGVDRPGDLEPAVARVKALTEREDMLFETYLRGEEVAVEGLLRHGELTVLAIFDKPDTPLGPFFPESILVTPSRLEADVQRECVRVSEAALLGLGLSHGPVHVELKVDKGRARVIEVAARSIGGLCSRTLSFGLMGTSLEALILRNALDLDKPELRREWQASGVLMIPIPSSGTLTSVDGVDDVRKVEGVTGIDLTIRPGERVLAPPDGDRYLGFVFARAASPEQVEKALRRAGELLEVRVQ